MAPWLMGTALNRPAPGLSAPDLPGSAVPSDAFLASHPLPASSSGSYRAGGSTWLRTFCRSPARSPARRRGSPVSPDAASRAGVTSAVLSLAEVSPLPTPGLRVASSQRWSLAVTLPVAVPFTHVALGPGALAGTSVSSLPLRRRWPQVAASSAARRLGTGLEVVAVGGERPAPGAAS